MTRTLSIDIGGSGIKVMVLDDAGEPVTERARLPTPAPATPARVLDTIVELTAAQGEYERVSAGFPGVVRRGVVWSAHNLDPSWIEFDLEQALTTRLGRPSRALNDADMQGFGAIEGQGVELVITLGTGFGSALFVDGTLMPNIELAHHPMRGGKTYEDKLGDAARRAVGKDKWNRRLARAVEQLDRLFNYDTLLIGGGNSRHVTLPPAERIRIVANVAGLLGGIACWRELDETPANRER